MIDDDEDILDIINEYLSKSNYIVSLYQNSKEWKDEFKKEKFDIIISDVNMPLVSGIEVLEYSKSVDPKIPVILMTAYSEVNMGVKAIKIGAYDYLQKPFAMEKFLNTIENALGQYVLLRKIKSIEKGLIEHELLDGIVGESNSLRSICDLVLRVAKVPSNILITGESGTGKEVVAKAIHNNSYCKNGPFIAINCSAIPEGLLESELFGYSKGSFTGALSDKDGLFKEASGGTLFLDEIGELPLNLQAKILRAIQEKEIRPIGKTISEKIDVRIVSATHKQLNKLSKTGEFREDLFFRLSVIPIHIPPLRERKEDIIVLAYHFFEKFKTMLGNDVLKGFSQKACQALVSMPWRGNVRELQNVVERSIILARGVFIEVEDLPTINKEDFDFKNLSSDLPTLKELESRYVSYVVEYTKGDKQKAARILGVNWRSVYRKMNSPSNDGTLFIH